MTNQATFEASCEDRPRFKPKLLTSKNCVALRKIKSDKLITLLNLQSEYLVFKVKT